MEVTGSKIKTQTKITNNPNLQIITIKDSKSAAMVALVIAIVMPDTR